MIEMGADSVQDLRKRRAEELKQSEALARENEQLAARLDDLGKARRQDQQKYEQLSKQLKRVTEERDKLKELLHEKSEPIHQKANQMKESVEIEKMRSELSNLRRLEDELARERESKQALQKVNADLHFEIQKLQKQFEPGSKREGPQISLDTLIDYEPDFDSIRSPASS